MDGFVALFAAAFTGLALPEDQAGDVFLEFSEMPSWDLSVFGKQFGLRVPQWDVDRWKKWLDQPGQQALLSALFVAGWACVFDNRKERWFYPSTTARIILGLQPAPELPAPTVEFKVLPNFCLLAGADLPPEKLVSLFRHCKIKRIDRIFEFQLDKRHYYFGKPSALSRRGFGWGIEPLVDFWSKAWAGEVAPIHVVTGDFEIRLKTKWPARNSALSCQHRTRQSRV